MVSEVVECPHCGPFHGVPSRCSWQVRVGEGRDVVGAPVRLWVEPADDGHVAETDAEWLRLLIDVYGTELGRNVSGLGAVRTVYVSIGNSDDKLTQREWAFFQVEVSEVIHHVGGRIHGEWASPARSQFQNACWCFDIRIGAIPEFERRMARIARNYRQDAIAVAVVGWTRMVGPEPVAAGAEDEAA